MENNCVYKITNQINNKCYIGQTTQGISRRWTEHKRDSKNRDSEMYKDMRKYGVHNFSVEVLESGLTQQELSQQEVYWIKKTESFERGYNLTTGGISGFQMSESTVAKISVANTGENNNMYGKTHSEEAREKISKAHKGKVMTKKQRKNMSLARQGEKNHFYGKHHTEETKDYLRQINLGRKHTESAKRKMSEQCKGNKHHNYGNRGRNSTYTVPIAQYDSNWKLIRKFDTVKETLEFLGMKGHTQLNKAIKNKTMYKNYYWSHSPLETIENTSYSDGSE